MIKKKVRGTQRICFVSLLHWGFIQSIQQDLCCFPDFLTILLSFYQRIATVEHISAPAWTLNSHCRTCYGTGCDFEVNVASAPFCILHSLNYNTCRSCRKYRWRPNGKRSSLALIEHLKKHKPNFRKS